MKSIRNHLFSILIFALVISLITYAFINMSSHTIENQKESLTQAMNRGILECYALEGRYPESLDYLKEEYYIVYNEDEFDIEYEIVGENMRPTFTIIAKN